MKFWIDGDSCPGKAMDIALKAHERRGLELVVVADREIPGVSGSGAEMRLVPHGSGQVDNLIAGEAQPGDFVLTRDFPLGIRLMEKGVKVMNDRGKIWTSRELKDRAEEAELMKAIRTGGITGKSRRVYNTDDSHAFAESLDHILNS